VQITDVLEESFCSLKVKIGNAISASDTSSDMNTVKPGVVRLMNLPCHISYAVALLV